MKSIHAFTLFAALATVLLYLFFLSVPLFGDTIGYGYSTMDWMRNNGYTPFAAGEGRGEQGMGHPTFFFWLWAILSGVLGKSLAVARILPALATFLALLGTYRTGSLLASPVAGWFSAIALAVSPLFMIQSMRPMPDSAVVAAVIWSVYLYLRGRYLPATLLCALGVIFREQAIFLAAAYFIAELSQTGFRKPLRLLLFASPVLVIAATGVINLAVNGYFFFPTYVGEAYDLQPGWFADRLRHFAGHLLAADYRWLLMCLVSAGLLRDRGRDTRSLPFMLALLFPAVFYPPERLLFTGLVVFASLVYLVRERLYTTRSQLVFLTVPSLMIAFHVLIVMVAPDPALDLFRYVLPAYPFLIIGGIAVLYRYYGRVAATVLTIIFTVATASANRRIFSTVQPDTSLEFAMLMRDYAEAMEHAVSLGDTILVTTHDRGFYTNPELGAVEEPVPVLSIRSEDRLSPDASYTLVLASQQLPLGDLERVQAMVPEGSGLIHLEQPSWNRCGNGIEIYRVIPE